EVMQLAHLRMLAQELRDGRGIVIGLFHADGERFERAPEHPAGMRIELRADGAAQRPDRLDDGKLAHCGPGDEVGMAADIFGGRIDRDVSAMVERRLEYRAEQRVVAYDYRPVALLPADLIGDT